jgi:hypothetical protein
VIEFYPNKLPDSYEGTPWCAVGTFADGLTLSQSPAAARRLSRRNDLPWYRTSERAVSCLALRRGDPVLSPDEGRIHYSAIIHVRTSVQIITPTIPSTLIQPKLQPCTL